MFIQCKLRLRTEETNAIYPFRIEEDPGCSGGNATGLRNRTAHLTESEWCGVRYRVLREVRGNFRGWLHRVGSSSTGRAFSRAVLPIVVLHGRLTLAWLVSIDAQYRVWRLLTWVLAGGSSSGLRSDRHR